MSVDAFLSLNLYSGCSSLFDECQSMHGQHFKTAALIQCIQSIENIDYHKYVLISM